MEFIGHLASYWPLAAAILAWLGAVLASCHAILHKRDSRAAVLWVSFIWFVPFLGPGIYLLLGINRVRRRAISLRKPAGHPKSASPTQVVSANADIVLPRLEAAHLEPLAESVGRIVGRSLIPGNKIEPLINGDAAYPAMLSAINSATRTISLSTYIFGNDHNGQMFVQALGEAVKRGVKVLVLIDDAGSHYSLPSIVQSLRHVHAHVALFLPSLAPWRLTTMNLRNHRKIMVVDGRIGFTGGMNLREGNLVAQHPRHPVQDLHFRVEGPVVAQLQEAFAADWAFAAKETIQGEEWFPALEPRGNVIARAIPDGPDADFEKFKWTLLSALACARRSVHILTPYFVPDAAIISAINLTALRGVPVDILLPSVNNLPYVHWASRALWSQVLQYGCRIWLTPPPFDHSKLMLVDGEWALVGSGNWDARSLRLNFELNLECYDRELVAALQSLVAAKLAGARQVTLDELNSRGLPLKLLDGVARLLTPYL